MIFNSGFMGNFMLRWCDSGMIATKSQGLMRYFNKLSTSTFKLFQQDFGIIVR